MIELCSKLQASGKSADRGACTFSPMALMPLSSATSSKVSPAGDLNGAKGR